MGIALMSIAIAATSGMFLASKRHMRMQERQLETTQAARAAVDMIVRDLRLGGACLPVTGDFISLDGINNGTAGRDHHPHRPHPAGSVLHPHRRSDGRHGRRRTVDGRPGRRAPKGSSAGMRVYIRDPERRRASISTSPRSISATDSSARARRCRGDYPDDQRHLRHRRAALLHRHLDELAAVRSPSSCCRSAASAPQSFAVGIEKLDIQYQLQRNCPPCDVVDSARPRTRNGRSSTRWSSNVTARSRGARQQSGAYYRRTVSVQREAAQPACPGSARTQRGQMRAQPMQHARDNRGMALIGVVILSALLMALAVALGVAVRSDTQLRGAFASGVTGFYAAESGLNKGMGEYRNIFLDYNVPHGSDFDPRTLTIGDRDGHATSSIASDAGESAEHRHPLRRDVRRPQRDSVPLHRQLAGRRTSATTSRPASGPSSWSATSRCSSSSRSTRTTSRSLPGPRHDPERPRPHQRQPLSQRRTARP